MTRQPVNEFQPVETQHCVTGSLRNIYLFSHFDLSEAMLLGLGEGVGFMYWHQQGQPPIFGGRAQPKPSMEELAGQRTGVVVQAHTTTSPRRAEQTLVKLLEAGQPVMLQVDMGFLPYFNFGGAEYHFGGHVVVAGSYNAARQEVLIADRDAELHPVTMHALAQARGSTFKPFPPKNRWYTFDFGNRHFPNIADLYMAIQHQTDFMLQPPIRNFGVRGMAHAAEAMPRWSAQMDESALRFALFNTYIFISQIGGTGGGMFRYMFSRFLREAAALAGDTALADVADTFQHIGDAWEQFGQWCRALSEAEHPTVQLPAAHGMLTELAALEQHGWTLLQHLVTHQIAM